ncbi:MAG: ltrA 2 [Defluviitaleaceae bacterium]|jgi:group II intron reverse transcriptase/maturase|nr:ltrA 2 [Defluviitaleaceae bacterium]
MILNNNKVNIHSFEYDKENQIRKEEMPVTNEKQKKNSKLRHLEYYNLQETLDKLYADSDDGKIFTNLMSLITQDENIRLAYRSIKRNSGSSTSGIDKITIRDIEKIPEEKFVSIVRKKLQWYKPKAVRRVEIPKPNGKMRPLGIPTMWDRIVQQCILQILEPICEAKFHDKSNGFRPNRSAEHAMAQAYTFIQKSHLHFVVDIDIKGFFDNVNHSKLIKQMWKLGIQDKKLLCVIKEMLKAPIVMPNGEMVMPTKGTPQGGILSPLLSNIVLNELDWWLSSQWEKHPAHNIKDHITKTGAIHRGRAYEAFRKSNLKEMQLVRYADDFKIFCKTYDEAVRAFNATKQWLYDRLKLEVSEEKSKIVNLRKGHSEFLGFKITVMEKAKSYVVKSSMCDKAKKRETENLIQQIKKIAHPKDDKERATLINEYNSKVMGMHNYYQIATAVSADFRDIGRKVDVVRMSQIKRKALSTKGEYRGALYIERRYGKSKQIRFVSGKPLAPVSYVTHKSPMWKRKSVCKFTSEGRKEIHKNLAVDTKTMILLMRAKEVSRTVEYMDNRISLYVAQNGKCSITGKVLYIDEIHCHHKIPVSQGGNDRYENLIILHKDAHRLLHATTDETVKNYLSQLKLTPKQKEKLNKLRLLAKLEKI